MSNSSEHRGAQVVSIDEFRRRIETPAPVAESEYDRSFDRADYSTTMNARRMLSYLNGEEAPENLAIFVRDVQKPTDVVALPHDQNWAYAVERNIDDVEALMLDLEFGKEALEPKLRDPLDRFCTLAFIAHNAITRGAGRLEVVPEIEMPVYIGDARIHIEGAERVERVNAWRAAGGLALVGVTQERPTLRRQMREYLAGVLVKRLEYVGDMEFMASISERLAPPPDKPEIGDDLLGLCNPFDEFGLRRAVKNLHNPQLD